METRHRLYIAHLGAGQIVVYNLKRSSVARVWVQTRSTAATPTDHAFHIAVLG